MKQIYVSLQNGSSADAPVPVGTISFDRDKGIGIFQYLRTYNGPPLDPINLNYQRPMSRDDRNRLAERVFFVNAGDDPGLLHQVFVDAMPGQWGMGVLQAEYPELRQMQNCERLHWMGSRTSGALSTFVSERADERPVQSLEELITVRRKCAEFQAKLEKMGLLGVRNPAVASHGGVMPKASYEDADGRHWIAKFDRPGEGLQYSVLEHTAVLMAKRCGIRAPESRVLHDGMGGHMYLTERYDRSGTTRVHKISMMTLLGAKEAGSGDYRDMFRVLREIVDPVAWPSQRDELLRRMAFNIGLNVTDDHLRNHEICLQANGSWALSPAFDMVPVSGPSPHQCAVFGQARATLNLDKPMTKAFWSKVSAELCIDHAYVFKLVEGVRNTICAEWPALVRSTGMNSFNQMNALMAAEVGCDAPFPQQTLQIVPMDPRSLRHAAGVQSALEKAHHMLVGAKPNMKEQFALAQFLGRAIDALPGVVDAMRQAGHLQQADMVMLAPLKAAAQALIAPDFGQPGQQHTQEAWRDLAEAARAIGSVLPDGLHNEIAAARQKQRESADNPTSANTTNRPT
jgi:serine/threonine-protein kinase HipA